MSPKRQKAKIGSLTNIIGDRGEKIFELLVTSYSGLENPLFKPSFLGEKWPTTDFYIELLGVQGVTPYFFVQVKSTANKISHSDKFIKINVSKKNAIALYKLPGPTYVVGISEPTSRCFIKSLHDQPATGITKISLENELTIETLETLFNEVKSFWSPFHNKPTTSKFL